MTTRTILVSAGHDDKAKGAVGATDNEADLTLDLRERIIAALGPVNGFTVIRDGKEDENEPLWRAQSYALKADLAVEVHFNPNMPKARTGSECFGTEDTKELCQKLAGACTKHMGRGLRGTKGYKHHSESQHPSLGFVRAGGVVLEVCFMTTSGMKVFLEKRDDIAREIADVLRGEASAILRASASSSLTLPDRRAVASLLHRPRHLVGPGSQSQRPRSIGAPQRRTRETRKASS